jgi:hypothetical protein
MELVAMDLKARGMYLTRTLSYQNTSFEIVFADLPGGFHQVLFYIARLHFIFIISIHKYFDLKYVDF